MVPLRAGVLTGEILQRHYISAMRGLPDRTAVGTLLRHVLELLDGDVAEVYRELGLSDDKPRFSPIVSTLVSDGPMPFRDLAP